MEAEKARTVIINGREKEVTDKELRFDQVVALAFASPPSGENVVITIVQVGNPATAVSRNCVISDPGGTACPTFNLNRIGVEYRITAQGDQGSFAETVFTRSE